MDRELAPNRTPLLGQGGVDAPSRKLSRSFEGAAGVVGSTTDNRWLEPTTPSAPAKEAARHFVDGRSHPSLAKEGSLARPKISHKIYKMIFLSLLCLFAAAFQSPRQVEWLYYGGDQAGTKYSSLADINAANVQRLEIAWQWKHWETPLPQYDKIGRAHV